MRLALELKPALAAIHGCDRLRGRSPATQELHRQIRRVAPTDATVLLAGETGTGKELAAQAIHELSDRRDGPFVALNCGAISAALIESELFGHEAGSFTGAARRHHGVFAQADKGTLLLDEITEMPLDLQIKLLRVLEDGSFKRIGGEQAVLTDVRVVAATNRPPQHAVREGRLRADLFYRLCVFPIELPPLRERGADLELLALYFLAVLNGTAGTSKTFAPGAIDGLHTHAWPGNVRELKHFVQRAFILADRELDSDALLCPRGANSCAGRDRIEILVGSSIAAAEQLLIRATMERCLGNKGKAAEVLGISLKTLYSRLNVYAATAALPA